MTTMFALRDNRPWLSLPRLSRRSPSTRLGFTLVELLVVIAIIGVLIALLLPAVQAARESGRRTQCMNQLKQVGLGIMNFESAKGKYPPGKKWALPRADPNSTSYSWAVHILPYLEQANISTQIDMKQRLTAPANLAVTGQIIPVYLCPSTSRIDTHRSEEGRIANLGGQPGEGLGCIDYLGVCGPDTESKNSTNGQEYGPQRGSLLGVKGLPNEDFLTEPPPLKPSDITDGTSQTMCVVECTGRGVDVKTSTGEVQDLNGAWASGSNISHIDKTVNAEKPEKSWDKERIFSDHPGGAMVLTLDGSVHFLSEAVTGDVIEQLCSRNGEEVINDLPF